MKKVIITVNIGGYDSVFEPEYIDEGFDYIYLSDKKIDSKVWKSIVLPENILGMSNFMMSRLIKVLFGVWMEYDLVVYMDSNMKQISSIGNFIEKYHKGTLTICKHPARNCIYEEAKECIRLGFFPEVKTNFQMLKYKQEGYPTNNGLVMCGFFIVTVNKNSIKFLNKWFDLIKYWECRDQLCFNKALWHTKYQIEIIPDNLVFGKVVKTHPHIHKKG
jgi:hypothetical protein